jgi:hypothetical protein
LTQNDWKFYFYGVFMPIILLSINYKKNRNA